MARSLRSGDPEAKPHYLLGQAAADAARHEAPNGDEGTHELKFNGCRMHARLDRGDVRLLTRTGLDWTGKYPAIAAALRTVLARQAYLDGELCGVRPDGSPLLH